jgi:hypothetical protein
MTLENAAKIKTLKLTLAMQEKTAHNDVLKLGQKM